MDSHLTVKTAICNWLTGSMFLASHYFISYHTAPAPVTSWEMSSMTPLDNTAFALAFPYKTFPQNIYSNVFFLERHYLTRTNSTSSAHSIGLLINVIFLLSTTFITTWYNYICFCLLSPSFIKYWCMLAPRDGSTQ